MTRTILVPFDGSEGSKAALDYAGELAGDERVVALVVVEPVPTEGHPEDQRAPYEQAFERAQDRLAGAETLAGDGRVDAEFCYGHPIHEILQYVDRYVVEEVVMGAHGRDEAGEVPLGSVAESVIRRSPVPVTVVRGETAETIGLPRSVLVAFDGSTPSRDALSYALERFPDAEVRALYADSPTSGDAEHLGPGGDRSTEFEDWYEPVGEWHERADRDADSVLGLAEDVADGYGRAIGTATEAGDPTRVVVDYAGRNDVDHVVVGSHGGEGVTRRLLGSVAAFVVRRSPTSVTVVR
ncbi:MAG: universal stress protein [Haloarculaceae archaeon]